MDKRSLQNAVRSVTKDSVCLASGRQDSVGLYNKLHQKASRHTTSSPQGSRSLVKVNNVTGA